MLGLRTTDLEILCYFRRSSLKRMWILTDSAFLQNFIRERYYVVWDTEASLIGFIIDREIRFLSGYYDDGIGVINIKMISSIIRSFINNLSFHQLLSVPWFIFIQPQGFEIFIRYGCCCEMMWSQSY